MTRIELETAIAAPVERCFDLSLSVDLHLRSAANTGERVVAGPETGLLGPGDRITWEARHLGRRWRLTTTISVFDRPRMFRDELVRGPFRRLVHDHRFEPVGAGTLMRDVFDFGTGLPPLDVLVVRPHLERFLAARNEAIRAIAEGEEWRDYLARFAAPL